MGMVNKIVLKLGETDSVWVWIRVSKVVADHDDLLTH